MRQTQLLFRDYIFRPIWLVPVVAWLLIPQWAAAQPINDNWESTLFLPAVPFNTTGNNINATTQPLEQHLTDPVPSGSTVWWYFTAPASGHVRIDTTGSNFDTVLHVYTDFQNGFGNFTLLASNDDVAGTLQSRVQFPVNAGQCYEVRVGGFAAAQGNIVLNGRMAFPPFNDNWNSGGSVLAFPFNTSGNNIDATTQPMEQDLVDTGSTAWWYFTAPTTGMVSIDTFGSDFDTVLDVYTDFLNGFGNFTLVASNDQAGGTNQSQVTFEVNAGQCYEVRVGGYFGAEGNIVLNGASSAPPPPNDDWSGPFLALPFFETGTNVNATTQPLEQNLEFTMATVWWFTEAPNDGAITIDTFASDFDTVLHIYTDFQNGFGNFTLVAANDQAGGTNQSRVSFPVNALQCYEIRVGGYFGDMGNIGLTGSFQSDAETLLGDVNRDGIISLLDVAPFVGVITSQTYQLEADVNEDDVISLLDVAPFVDVLTGG